MQKVAIFKSSFEKKKEENMTLCNKIFLCHFHYWIISYMKGITAPTVKAV